MLFDLVNVPPKITSSVPLIVPEIVARMASVVAFDVTMVVAPTVSVAMSPNVTVLEPGLYETTATGDYPCV